MTILTCRRLADVDFFLSYRSRLGDLSDDLSFGTTS